MKTRYLLYILFSLLFFVFILSSISTKYENYTPTPPVTSPLNVLYTDKLGNINKTVLISPGTIALWPDPIPPIGWVMCDGTNGTPDLRGKFVVGVTYGSVSDTQDRVSSSLNIGDTGGVSEITINSDYMPTHTHNVTSTFDNTGIIFDGIGDHQHRYDWTWIGIGKDIGNGRYWYLHWPEHYDSSGPIGEGIDENGNHKHDLTVTGNPITTTMSSIGGNQSKTNLPPYVCLNYIMKL